MLVEYLQHEFLDSLYKQKGAEKLSFIGGTAIRIVYGSQRFSEDLDFDNYGLNYANFNALLEKACREIQIKGFELEYRIFKKEEAFHAYLRFPSILRQYEISAHHLEKIFVAVDAEKKKKLVEPEIKLLNRFGVFRNIIVNKSSVLLAQKLLAILYRKRGRGRDFYDASFLSGLTKPDYGYLKLTTKYDKDKFIEALKRRCAKLNYQLLAKDVQPFLFEMAEIDRILNFSHTMEKIF